MNIDQLIYVIGIIFGAFLFGIGIGMAIMENIYAVRIIKYKTLIQYAIKHAGGTQYDSESLKYLAHRWVRRK